MLFTSLEASEMQRGVSVLTRDWRGIDPTSKLCVIKYFGWARVHLKTKLKFREEETETYMNLTSQTTVFIRLHV